MAKILIVDDEPFIRRLIEECLEKFTEKGVQLLFADNGQAAIETIRLEKPDLVFLDVMLPKLNGYEVCRMVKMEHSLKDVTVVMLTAKGQDLDRTRDDGMRADVFMSKPFRPDEVVAKASQILGISVGR